ncbi:MAG TPA: hypothetical protein VHD76_05885 [Bryobacteraceae bacterium]|jgi:hypothetical protein|nr:hypothetical protein [Bryobacteraceae bacterium]
MCRGIVYFVIACSLAVGAFAQDSTDASYSGTWLLQNNSGTKLILEQHEDQIRVREVNSSGTLVDYTCNTLGKECEIKDDGHKAKVSLWFNGNDLIELETRGSVVVKRKFQIRKSGKEMEVETIPIAPAGKSETVAFSLASEG